MQSRQAPELDLETFVRKVGSHCAHTPSVKVAELPDSSPLSSTRYCELLMHDAKLRTGLMHTGTEGDGDAPKCPLNSGSLGLHLSLFGAGPTVAVLY